MGTKVYRYESFGETLEEAEYNGFDADGAEDAMYRAYGLGPDDPRPESLRCEVSDALEEMAVEYLRELGWTVVGYDDEQCEPEWEDWK